MKLLILNGFCKIGLISAILLAAGPLSLPAGAQIAVKNQGYVPFSEEPINYRSDVHDPVAELQRRMARGEVKLEYEPRHGYLRSVLENLSIPVNSQTLVFFRRGAALLESLIS